MDNVQEYIDEILKKFNKDQEDESLTSIERTLLNNIVTIQKEINEVAQRIDALENEVMERRNSIIELTRRLDNLQGQSQGLLNSIVALKEQDCGK